MSNKTWIKWTEEDNKFLIENYNNKSAKELSETLNRTVLSIHSRAKYLNLDRKCSQLNQKEIDFIYDNFNKMQVKQIAKILDRNISVVGKYCRSVGLNKNDDIFWADDELKTLYSLPAEIYKQDLLNLFSRRTESSIRGKIKRLGLKVHILEDSKLTWGNYEIEILLNNLGKISKSELLKLLPNKNWKSIQNKINNSEFKFLNFRNRYDIFDEYSILYIMTSIYDIIKVKIDNIDVEKCKLHKWNYSNGYVMNENNELLHRFIMNAKDNDIVDHLDGDTLDDRRKSLRICTIPENIQNRVKLNKNNKSGYRGVHTQRGRIKKWVARLKINRIGIHLGYFYTKEEANFVVRLGRAYIMPFSKDFREIKQEDIPQWIKDKIDNQIKRIA